ncbi:hypothetical protein KFL_002910030 [Klebsormidium nitens]|uniref:U5 small nuclear ribonucleoprotein TSSC4 n=1 Tax=Klebsormidium nitens TaxID=105231 RepID=A0A1Y1I681_KLENI|nr:hypothetical protein KFL_002910030 [Klebsormidium nitens]|eukprot:GAQ86465.1 hypothetical protein KFL_002910030 [Klebsormidium nitens]
MEAFSDRVARAFGALGGAMPLSGTQTSGTPPQTAAVIDGDRTFVSSTEAIRPVTGDNAGVSEPVSDWQLASSRGFGLVSKRRDVVLPGPEKTADGAPLWSVAQKVERKKRMWEEIESSDDDEFDKKRKGEVSKGREGEGDEEGDGDAEGEMVSYVPLTEEPENAEEEGEWVRQMIGQDDALDNEEEEDGYDRMAAPTGTDPLGRMHTSAIGDADEPFAKHVSFSRGRRDLRANRDAAAKRLQEDDEELERAKIVERGGAEETSGQAPSKPGSTKALKRAVELVGRENEEAEEMDEGKGGVSEQSAEGSREAGTRDVEFDEAAFDDAEASKERVGGEAGSKGWEESGSEDAVEDSPVEGVLPFSSASEAGPSRTNGLDEKEQGAADLVDGAEPIPDEQPLNFPNYRSGFMSNNVKPAPAAGALKRPPEKPGIEADEPRSKKRVRFTEEVTDRDEQRARDKETEEDLGKLFRGGPGRGAAGGSLQGSRGRGVANGERYVPPHRRPGYAAQASRVPDHVRHPERYTVYTLDWSDEEDERNMDGTASEAKQNEGAFLAAVGRLKGEIGNIRFEEAAEMPQAGGETNGDVSVEAEGADVSAMEGERSNLPVKFVKRRKCVAEKDVDSAKGNERGVKDEENGAGAPKPQIPIAASIEELTQSLYNDEEDNEMSESVGAEGNGELRGFRKKSNGERPNKRYRVRAADEDG